MRFIHVMAVLSFFVTFAAPLGSGGAADAAVTDGGASPAAALPAAASAASAPLSAGPAPPVKGPPLRMQVGILLLNVGRLDTGTGTYTMDLYLTFRCDRPCEPEKFEVANGRIVFQQKQEDFPTYKVYRLQAALTIGMDLRRYPFDRHALSLVMEDNVRDITELVYVADPQHSFTDPDLQVAGWQLTPGIAVHVEPHYYELFNQSYSHYVASVEIRRPLLAALVKGLMPAIIMTLCGLMSLLMTPDKFNQRLSLATSSLLGTVIYHLTITSAIPPVAYLTFADRFMIGNYSCLLLTVATTMLLMRYLDRSDAVRTERVRLWSLRTVPLLWLGLQVVNLLQL
jgi:hypothetical protein